MTIGLDIDGTITAFPDFYRRMARMYVAEYGIVHIITARCERDRQITRELLYQCGFSKMLHKEEALLHMFPEDYEFPMRGPQDVIDATLLAHANWKARTCLSLGVLALYDDSELNVRVCRQAGIYAVHVDGVYPAQRL